MFDLGEWIAEGGGEGDLGIARGFKVERGGIDLEGTVVGKLKISTEIRAHFNRLISLPE